MTAATQTLISLRDSHMATRDRAEDIRGCKVVDAAGKDIGKVEGLLIDEHQKKIRFLQVASGGFLGMGELKVLIPVEAVSKISGDVVHVDQTHEHIAGAPGFDPKLHAVGQRYYEGLYAYYGYGPFWGPDYVYPPFPRNR